MLDFSFFLTDFFLDVNNRRSVQHFFLMLLGRLTLPWMALPFLTRYFGWEVKLIPILPHPLPRNYPEGRVQGPLYPSRFCGFTSYQRPTTFFTHKPRLLVTPTLFSRRKSFLYLFFLWILTNSSIILSLFDTQIIYCLTRQKKCLYSKRELNCDNINYKLKIML